MYARLYYAALPARLQALKASLPAFLEPAERQAVIRRIDAACEQARILSRELARHEDRH